MDRRSEGPGAGPALPIRVLPAEASRWPDLEGLFGERGACAGCWCQYWRLSHSAFWEAKGEPNRRALREQVLSGEVPGVLAYLGKEAVGWCALAPREDYPRLARSRILRPVDELAVWSVPCLFVARPQRRKGVSVALLRGAVDRAVGREAHIVEGYPVEPRPGGMPDAFAWTGTASAFLQAGFREVARRSETRPIMRWFARPP